ncbi:MAG TPA: hypothetical protein VH639_19060 [Bryobacteraceae bacterium]|jgi:hypothetical protein
MSLEIAISIALLFGAVSLSAAAGSSAVILNSGSTNTAGFRLVVDKSGDAEYIPMPRKYGPQGGSPTEPTRRKLPDVLVQRFYSDLEAAKPLSGLPKERCMKSASFGTTTIVQFGGEETPDLSCPTAQNPHTKALMRDVDEISGYFH